LAISIAIILLPRAVLLHRWWIGILLWLIMWSWRRDTSSTSARGYGSGVLLITLHEEEYDDSGDDGEHCDAAHYATCDGSNI
jgi:hypothetical protein